MALTKWQKIEVLNNIKELIKDSKSVGFTSNLGLSVEEITNLRVSLREVWASFMVAKKTLIKIAFKEVFDVEIKDEFLPNQIALVISTQDAISGLSKVNASKKWLKDKIIWSACFLDWEIKDAEETKVIASMPSRETLLWRLVGSMQSPMSSFARVLDAIAKDKAEWVTTETKNEETPKEEIKETKNEEKIETESTKTLKEEEKTV